VQDGGKTLSDPAGLPFTCGKEHWDFAAEEICGVRHANVKGNSHASAGEE
jgi:hypothetical protein